MKKIATLILIFESLLNSQILFGQKEFFSFGVELANTGPSSGLNWGEGQHGGIGGSIRVETWGKHFSGIATIGYVKFSTIHQSTFNGSNSIQITSIPYHAGLKYYPMKRISTPIGFFISAEIGGISSTEHFTYEHGSDDTFNDSGLSIAPGIGYLFRNFEANFRLQYNLNVNGYNVYYYNLRLAYALMKKETKN